MIWYKVLGVSKSASEEEIKAAYKGLVRIYHHDRFVGRPQIERKQAEEKMKEINIAYDEALKYIHYPIFRQNNDNK